MLLVWFHLLGPRSQVEEVVWPNFRSGMAWVFVGSGQLSLAISHRNQFWWLMMPSTSFSCSSHGFVTLLLLSSCCFFCYHFGCYISNDCCNNYCVLIAVVARRCSCYLLLFLFAIVVVVTTVDVACRCKQDVAFFVCRIPCLCYLESYPFFFVGACPWYFYELANI